MVRKSRHSNDGHTPIIQYVELEVLQERKKEKGSEEFYCFFLPHIYLHEDVATIRLSCMKRLRSDTFPKERTNWLPSKKLNETPNMTLLSR